MKTQAGGSSTVGSIPVSRVFGVAGPALVTLIVATAVLQSAGVPVQQTLLFLCVQLLGYTIPGALWWRALRGGADNMLVDLTVGSILGHALTLGLYMLLRWWGWPLGVWLFALVTIVSFAAVPSLRRHWGLRHGTPAPAWFRWNVALATSVALMLLGPAVPQVSGNAARWPGSDSPYLLSLAAELKHHMPPQIPFVAGEPLHYHWFTFVDIAAISWQGGQELDLLTFALVPMWCLAIGMLAFAALGARLANSHLVGAVALWLAALVGSINLFGWFRPIVTDSTWLFINWFWSPTMALAAVFAIATLLVFVDILRCGDAVRRSSWLLAAILSLALMGTKATVIPVLGAGVLTCFLLALPSRGAVMRRSLVLGLLLGAELAFAQVVLFGGASQGMRVSVIGTAGSFHRALGIRPGRIGDWIVVAVLMLGWFAPLCGALFLLLRRGGRSAVRGTLADPAVSLIAGMVLASVAAVLLLVHPGYSQFMFLESGLPFGYLLVAWGGVLAIQKYGRTHWLLLGISAAVGLGTVVLTRQLTEHLSRGGHTRTVLAVVGLALLAPGFVVLVNMVVSRRFSAGVALCALGVSFVAMGAMRTVDMAPAAVENLSRPRAAFLGLPAIPPGGFVAARFVRDRSQEDDLIATNAHCRYPNSTVCKNTAHWMSAWTERRAVVEGWGYTESSNSAGRTMTEITTSPFRNQALLALNDRVFNEPTQKHLEELTSRYRVRWLVVDLRFAADVSGLERLLPLHRTFGQILVLEVPPA